MAQGLRGERYSNDAAVSGRRVAMESRGNSILFQGASCTF